MLAIRMQRTGRKGHAMFRILVQDSRRTPSSGKYVALLGSYDPHNKTTTLVKDKVGFYLEHGAQPSDRVVRLLKSEGVKLPSWIETDDKKTGAIRNPEKLRRNRPAEVKAPVAEASPEIVEESPPEVSSEAKEVEVADEVVKEDEASVDDSSTKTTEPDVAVEETVETEESPTEEITSEKPEENPDSAKAE